MKSRNSFFATLLVVLSLISPALLLANEDALTMNVNSWLMNNNPTSFLSFSSKNKPTILGYDFKNNIGGVYSDENFLFIAKGNHEARADVDYIGYNDHSRIKQFFGKPIDAFGQLVWDPWLGIRRDLVGAGIYKIFYNEDDHKLRIGLGYMREIIYVGVDLKDPYKYEDRVDLRRWTISFLIKEKFASISCFGIFDINDISTEWTGYVQPEEKGANTNVSTQISIKKEGAFSFETSIEIIRNEQLTKGKKYDVLCVGYLKGSYKFQ